MKNKLNVKKIFVKGIIFILSCLMVFFVVYGIYYKKKQEGIVLKTQYTYSVRIDNKGNVIDEETTVTSSDKKIGTAFENMALNSIANIWLKAFSEQFTQQYVPLSMALKNVSVNKIQVLNPQENVVFIGFSAEVKSGNFDYFSSWKGYTVEEKLVCEWVVQFEIEDLYDNTARIYAKSIQQPDEYGMAAYNNITAGETETKLTEALGQYFADNQLYGYELKGDTLQVTYDGGARWTLVPVGAGNLLTGGSEQVDLERGTFVLSSNKTAFLYRGSTGIEEDTSLTVMFTDDQGNNWTHSVIEYIKNLNLSYINFFTPEKGVVFADYSRTSKQQMAVIYTTLDGGETWIKKSTNQLPGNVTGVNFINESTGFFTVSHTNETESNLYITKNGGMTFIPVILQEQEFENASTKAEWKSVYSVLQLPDFDESDKLVLLVKQAPGGNYNGGSYAAKYQSNDLGATWEYVGEVDLTSTSEKK